VDIDALFNKLFLAVRSGGTAWIMNISEFEDLIDRLGEDISTWPDVQRQAATRLLASSPETVALLAQARALREALSAPPVRAPAGLADRIFAAASKLKSETSQASRGEERPALRAEAVAADETSHLG
jgi:hypothetical protein